MAAKRPILIIEDDLALRQALVEHLSEDDAFNRSRRARWPKPCVISIRRRCGRTSSCSISASPTAMAAFCTQLRRQGHHMPIIMLTGASGAADIVQGLQNGASDYVCKPFRVAELSARIRAQLRAFDASENATFTVGPYIFRPAVRTLIRQADGRKIHLTIKEATLLRYLLHADGMTVGTRSC